MAKKITFEESLRSQYALKIAMDTTGVSNPGALNSFLNASRRNNSPRTYLSTKDEGVVKDSSEYLLDRQKKVDRELSQIEENNFARQQSDQADKEQYFDEEKYWRTLVSTVRFHRIEKGKGGSKAPPRSKTRSDTLSSNTIFDIKNIWYFLKPYVGERAYFAYKYGPAEFFHSEKVNLWSVLFDHTHPDSVIFGDSLHNPFRIIPVDHSLLSAQELARELIKHHEAVGPNWFKNSNGFGTLIAIAVLKNATTELSYRLMSKTHSDSLYLLLLESSPIKKLIAGMPKRSRQIREKIYQP